jgi:hypothetical protein
LCWRTGGYRDEMVTERNSRHWWQDQIARLIITVIGGVIAALILVFLIPAVGNSGDGSSGDDPPVVGEDAPATGDAPSEPNATPAEGG